MTTCKAGITLFFFNNKFSTEIILSLWWRIITLCADSDDTEWIIQRLSDIRLVNVRLPYKEKYTLAKLTNEKHGYGRVFVHPCITSAW